MAFFTYFDHSGHRQGYAEKSSRPAASAREHMEMLEAAGFADITEIDLTAQFSSTAKAWYEWRGRYRAALTQSEGRALFNERQSTYSRHVRSVEAGARLRYLFVARRR